LRGHWEHHLWLMIPRPLHRRQTRRADSKKALFRGAVARNGISDAIFQVQVSFRQPTCSEDRPAFLGCILVREVGCAGPLKLSRSCPHRRAQGHQTQRHEEIPLDVPYSRPLSRLNPAVRVPQMSSISGRAGAARLYFARCHGRAKRIDTIVLWPVAISGDDIVIHRPRRIPRSKGRSDNNNRTMWLFLMPSLSCGAKCQAYRGHRNYCAPHGFPPTFEPRPVSLSSGPFRSFLKPSGSGYP
jgi:hypothetical protein